MAFAENTLEMQNSERFKRTWETKKDGNMGEDREHRISEKHKTQELSHSTAPHSQGQLKILISLRCD